MPAPSSPDSSGPRFTFEPSVARLSDPLRTRPTTLITRGAASNDSSTGSSTHPYLLESIDDSEIKLAAGDGPLGDQEGPWLSWSLIKYGAVKFMTTSVVEPFDLANTLAQVQYLPNDRLRRQWSVRKEGAPSGSDMEMSDRPAGYDETSDFASSDDGSILSSTEEEEAEDDDDDDDEDSIPSDDPEYYNPDRRRRRTTGRGPGGEGLRRRQRERRAQASMHTMRRARKDTLGYLSTVDPHATASRPPYQLPPLEGSSWSTFQAMASSPHEGFLGLWKGQGAHWTHEMLLAMMQPSLEGWLNGQFGLYDDTIPLAHLEHVGPNLATLVSSHALVGLLLSPLELVRTRMIVQTGDVTHRRYPSTLHALFTLVTTEHEHSFVSLYLQNPLLGPTLLVHTLRPLLHHAAPLLIERVLSVSRSEAPALYALSIFAVNTLGAVVLMPVETVRKRLQVQTRGGARELATCVAVGRGYTGFGDCLRRVVMEEGGRRSMRTSGGKHGPGSSSRGGRSRSSSWGGDGWGVQGLYRGFGTQIVLNAATALLGLLNGLPTEDDW